MTLRIAALWRRYKAVCSRATCRRRLPYTHIWTLLLQTFSFCHNGSCLFAFAAYRVQTKSDSVCRHDGLQVRDAARRWMCATYGELCAVGTESDCHQHRCGGTCNARTRDQLIASDHGLGATCQSFGIILRIERYHRNTASTEHIVHIDILECILDVYWFLEPKWPYQFCIPKTEDIHRFQVISLILANQLEIQTRLLRLISFGWTSTPPPESTMFQFWLL